MKRGKQIDSWFPFFIDKWLFGSTRHELIISDNGSWVDLRGIWTDLLTLSRKDGGYVRANETTPYPLEQLAGMFCVPIPLLKKTIDICIEKGKISEPAPGIFYIESTDTYTISDRHKRRMSEKTDMASEKADSKEKEIKENKNKENETIQAEFAQFWEAYPEKEKKQDALKAYTILRRTVPLETIVTAFNGYIDFLKHKRLHENFEQRPMYAATFLREERWKDYLDFKYKPKL